jgi:APA family basic amino acid/polyamine antiporter
LVVASMVGTGVFTTTGLLVANIPSARGILLCWLVSGLAALCGALSYAELAAAYGKSGGEYHYLSRLFHPSLGFLSAWVSLIVGFAAPLAAIALAFGKYLAVLVPGAPEGASGAVLVVILSALNVWRVSAGAGFQNLFTLGKVLLIFGLVGIGLSLGDASLLAPAPVPASESWRTGYPLLATVLSGGFAVGLMWVSFAYTGWNAAAYVAGEVKDPGRVLPRALTAGTLLVTVLYLGLNATFLMSAPLSELAGKVEVGHVAATHLLGEEGGRVVTAIIALGLVSTISAIVVTGPRIYEAVGHDFPKLRFLAKRSDEGGPIVAIALQTGLALLMMMTARFEQLLSYIGFTLSIFGALTVLGVFILRRRRTELPFRMPGYPVVPAVYVALMAWMVVHGLILRPYAALAGLGTVAVGGVFYLASK